MERKDGSEVQDEDFNVEECKIVSLLVHDEEEEFALWKSVTSRGSFV